MATAKTLQWIERLVWILIYGGLFMLVLGIAIGRQDAPLGWVFAIPGVVLALVGVVLIYVRSRLDRSS